MLGVADDELPRAAGRPRVAQHAFGNIQRHAVGLREPRRQRAGEIAGPAAQVEPARRRRHVRQCGQQIAADPSLQGSDAVVAGGGTGKGRRHLALVGQHARRAPAEGRLSHPRPHP